MLKLGDIEDAPVFHAGAFKRNSFPFRLAVRSENRLAVFIQLVPIFMKLPVKDGLPVFSLFDAVSLFIRLRERHIPGFALVFHCAEP